MSAEQLELFDPVTQEPFVVRNPVEVAPGVFSGDIPPSRMPRRAGIVRFVPNKTGGWTPQVTNFGGFMAMGADIGKELGMHGPSIAQTIRRLMAGGFVRYTNPSPKLYMVDLHDLARHWRESAKPGFWTPERIERYRAARDGLHQASLTETAASFTDPE